MSGEGESRVRRVLHRGNPTPEEYRAMGEEIASIRSDLAAIRRRLAGVARHETEFWFDSTAQMAEGSLTLIISGLYRLESGDESFPARAEHVERVWEDAEANPDQYVIEEGCSWRHGRRGDSRFTEEGDYTPHQYDIARIEREAADA